MSTDPAMNAALR